MVMNQPPARRQQPAVNAGRLWAGGAAAAVVAALIAIAGIVIARGIFDIPVLAPKGDGVWGGASTVWYAVWAAVAGLLATAVAHVLLLTTPQPRTFFGWIIGLATVIAALWPFTSGADLDAKIVTMLLNLVIGIAIGSLVSAVAQSAIRPEPMIRPEPRGDVGPPRP
ncbi:DUF6069 family protein [Nocardioides albus]|uniref:Uncharacterized protein n=1 Tax=Nocardioides albus TaxID=1841 RepID=A0A7W5FAF2_9ACTN|nr:DUF6069 family protein [Nocardioides albus]MBB3091092.1 hypothetical protein [Nocardioides albus]GGU34396.1 hypothetical protein GCM10007979_36930 [Nocardioides albus]